MSCILIYASHPLYDRFGQLFLINLRKYYVAFLQNTCCETANKTDGDQIRLDYSHSHIKLSPVTFNEPYIYTLQNDPHDTHLLLLVLLLLAETLNVTLIA